MTEKLDEKEELDKPRYKYVCAINGGFHSMERQREICLPLENVCCDPVASHFMAVVPEDFLT